MSGGFKVDDLGSTRRSSQETSSSVPPPGQLHLALPHPGHYRYLEKPHLCNAGFQISDHCLCLPVSTSLFFALQSFILTTPLHLIHSGFISLGSWTGPRGCSVSVMFTLTPWGLGIRGLCQSQHSDPEAWLPHSFPHRLIMKVS